MTRYDALVLGAGPAGSTAALTLARGGARVALVDKARFPRDKACGDLIGPRGVQLLADLGLEVPGAGRAGDMAVVGPTGRSTLLKAVAGSTYPGHALVVPRTRFDALLHDAATAAGAEAMSARADQPLHDEEGRLEGFRLSTGHELRADVVIGADGATSRVAEVAGLVDGAKVLWGFAVRAYVPDPIELPHIVLWERERWRAFPGYGWAFPGLDGCANVGLGLGLLGDRSGGSRASRELDAFCADLRRLGVLQPDTVVPKAGRLGGWLKMGMVGTVPARDNVLLVGDAAGLVNPLQGEGIAQGMASGQAAAEAVLAGPSGADGRYRAWLRAAQAPYQAVTASVQAAVLPRPRAVSAIGRLLTAPVLSGLVAGAWGMYWNDLVEGALPGPDRTLATVAQRAGTLATSAAGTRRWVDGAVA